MRQSIWIGYDPREAACFAVARHSFRYRLSLPLPVRGIMLEDMRQRGLYWRETTRTDAGQLYDVISAAPMSTEFAISRFLTPHLAGSGWALFTDCDVMARANAMHLFALADPSKAVMCVKHDFNPSEGVKMDGQAQLRYRRKNWSSVMLFNCDHPSNKKLTVDLINSVHGRDLHSFCWLDDDEIGSLPTVWNYLVGHTVLTGEQTPKIVHWTDGAPIFSGYEHVKYADEFRAELMQWVANC